MERTTELRTLSLEKLPVQLSHIPHPPQTLWARGSLPPDETRLLAVVGSRALSGYGRMACEQLIRGLAGYPISIVSGLALGADGCAHEAALAAGLHTIAIPGSGLADFALGPRSHVPLARRVLAAGGLLLSEHPPEHHARPYDFPSRNRIMVGLAHAVLMIEAGPDSGTLITAGLAGDYGRELLCVPHRIGDPHGYGMARFVRLGASIVTESEHILEALGIDSGQLDVSLAAASSLARLSPDASELLAQLSGASALDSLVRATTWSTSRVLVALAELELAEAASERNGQWWRTVP